MVTTATWKRIVFGDIHKENYDFGCKKNSQFLWLGITVYDHPQFLDIISNLRQHISQCVDYIFLLEVCNLSQGNQNIFQK